MATSRIEDRLRAWAEELGFFAVGFVPASEAISTAEFERWARSERAAGLEYLRRHVEARRDPRRVWADTRTIVCVAAAYPVNPEPGLGGFSTYARGADYHEVLRAKLRSLLERWRREQPALRWRIAVDSAPILEREWACRAGLGWLGRQGQLIHPEHGACLFLAEALVNVELDPTSVSVPSRCGVCRRCVEACPTKAIGEDGHVDVRRCLSYLTIEHRGAFSEEQTATLDGTLFGCDRCTAVCPWNATARPPIMTEFANAGVPTAEQILQMDEAAFRARFHGTPVARAGLDRLQRNACALMIRGETND